MSQTEPAPDILKAILLFRGSSNFGPKLWKLKDEFTDMVILCGKEKAEFRGHKIVFAASSSFFKEKLDNSNTIEVHNVTKGEFSFIFEYIYRGEVKIPITQRNRFLDLVKQLKIEHQVNVPKKSLEELRANYLDSGPGKRKVACETFPRLFELPPEIVTRILSFVSTTDLLLNVARASKRFNELTKNPMLHRTVKINSSPFAIQELKRRSQGKLNAAINFLENTSLIKELQIQRKLPVTGRCLYSDTDIYAGQLLCDELVRAACVHPTLRAIKIFSSRDFITLGCLADLRLICPDLTQLSSSIKFTQFGSKKSFSLPKNLKVLDVDLFPALFSKVVKSNQNFVGLKRLTENTEDDFIKIVERRKESLQEVGIGQAGMTRNGFLKITSCQNLTRLSILSSTFTSVEILESLKHLKELEILIFPPEISKHLLKLNLFGSMNSLESLKIVTRQRYEDQVRRLEETIYNPLAIFFQLLKHLSFRSADSSRPSLAIITPFIKNCPLLETIVVENLIDTGNFLEDIALHLRKLKLLAMLNEKVSLYLASKIIEDRYIFVPETLAVLSQDAVFVRQKSDIPEVTAMIENLFQGGIVCPKFRPIYAYNQSHDILDF